LGTCGQFGQPDSTLKPNGKHKSADNGRLGSPVTESPQEQHRFAGLTAGRAFGHAIWRHNASNGPEAAKPAQGLEI